MVSVVRRYEITDPEWERIKPYIPEEQEARTRGRPSKDSRTMLNGIFWILRSGAAWRDLPERYGPWQTVYKRFVKWSEAGIFEKIFKDLAADADMQDISIDSTCIKAHKSSAGAKKEKS
jgi:transposase